MGTVETGETFALATLRDMISNLQDHIDHRAAEIAAPRIAAAEQRAVEAEQLAEKAWRDRAQRDDDLRTELGRRLAALERRYDRLWWLSQYLPEPLHRFAPKVPSGLAEQLPGDWCAAVARHAAPDYDPQVESELLMLIEAIELVVNSGSAARFQRKMRVGFATAAKLLIHMEELGVVGPEEAGGRPREVLIKPDALPGMLAELRAPRDLASQQTGEVS